MYYMWINKNLVYQLEIKPRLFMC